MLVHTVCIIYMHKYIVIMYACMYVRMHEGLYKVYTIVLISVFRTKEM